MRVLSIAFALATVSEGAVGGAEQVLACLDRELVRAGHESIVVAATNSQIYGKLIGTAVSPPLITSDYYRFRYVEHSKKIHEALRTGPIDLIHMHGFDFWEFLPKVDIPILATLHLPVRWYVDWIYTRDLPHCYFNCVSDSQRAGAPHSARIVQTIQNGVEIPDEAPLPISDRQGAMILGRICPEKGTHIGIAAARQAGLPLTVAGQPLGYPEHLRYFKEQILPALGDAITYSGPVAGPAKFRMLRSAKCLLVPSLAPETSSLVAMEALAHGTPVIAMNSGALPEIVEHGKTGFIVDSCQAMSAAMSHVDEIDPMTCYQTAARRFSAHRMSREYFDLCQRLILSKRVVTLSQGERHVGSVSQPTV